MTSPSLTIGDRLGRYEVVDVLGSGGMGEVYRARDPQLGRDVAIKVVRREALGDETARVRFEREARVVAALSHPNIVSIHDVGTEHERVFAVTELLEGETLRARLDRGAMPWRKAVEIASSIADGLGAAHAKGIVHRDLKPANIFLTVEGCVKVLDFGLAKLRQPESLEGSASTTLSQSQPGRLLGTVGYMSPEQVAGKPADARSDIFSLGCLLYESVSGKRAFARPTPAETMAAILNEEPLEPHAVPTELRRLIAHCLEKDSEARCQNARDLAYDLRAIAGSSPSATGSLPTAHRRHRLIPLAAIVVLAGAVAVGRLSRHDAHPPQASRIIPLTSGGDARDFGPTLSPDGKFVAYLSRRRLRTEVWVKFIGGGPPVAISADSKLSLPSGTFFGGIEITPDGTGVAVHAGPSGTSPEGWGTWIFPVPAGGPPRKLLDHAAAVRWSPDAQRLVFLRIDNARGYSVLTARGDGQDERVLISPVVGLRWVQPSWSHDGAYVYVARQYNLGRTELWRVASSGGAPQPVVTSPPGALYPEPTPDGLGLVYTGPDNNIWWQPLAGGTAHRLTTGAGDYLEQRFSRDGRRLVAAAGRTEAFLAQLSVEARDQDDPRQPLTIASTGDTAPTICARTGRLAFISRRNGSPAVWTADARGEDARPLTSGGFGESKPALSPDGGRIAFIADDDGQRGIWLVSGEGGTARRVVETTTGRLLGAVSWSPDGQRFVFSDRPKRRPQLWIVEVDGGTPHLVEGVEGHTPAWSPSGDVIAYVAADSSLRFTTSKGEAVLPELTRQFVGATAMAWSHDGSRLAIVAGNSGGTPELWMLETTARAYHRIATLPGYARVTGIAWSPDNGSLIFGRSEFEGQILMLDGLH